MTVQKNSPLNRSKRITRLWFLLAFAFLITFVFNSRCLADGSLFKDDGKWTENFEMAVKKAEEEDKDLFLLFTGSDWCPPCQRLEEEVLSHEDFQNEADRSFVLVKLDFPKTNPQPEEIKNQNAGLASDFGITGYPTVVLADAELKPYGITGYQEGGVENYLGAIEEFRQIRITRDEKLKEAEGAEGLDRARLLDEAIAGIDEKIVNVYYEEIVTEIVELDKDDELGLRSKYNAQRESEMRKIIIADIRTICRLEKPEKAILFIDELIRDFDFPDDERLQILQLTLSVIRKTGDNVRMDELLDEMIGLEGVAGDTHERLVVKKILLMAGTGRSDEAMALLENSIAEGGRNMYLLLARGELQHAAEDFAAAITSYDAAMEAAGGTPDVLVEAVAGKADSQFSAGDQAAALQTLDNFADNSRMPSDLRSESLLHKSMLLRDTDRRRQAILAENRAVEIAESPSEKAEVEKLIARLHERFADQ